jgi:L-threonylcarbamoyladenylate synthase
LQAEKTSICFFLGFHIHGDFYFPVWYAKASFYQIGHDMELTLLPIYEALEAGRLCLLPTDTILGLSLHPLKREAWRALEELKARESQKPCVHLIASPEQAFAYWRPLPAPWTELIIDCWQAGATLIWELQPHIEAPFRSLDRTLALRIPYGQPSLLPLLTALKVPLPTTSLNRSGTPPITTWESAMAFVQNTSVFVPDPGLFRLPDPHAIPSTLLQIHEDGSASLLREGKLTRAQLSTWKGIELRVT